MRENEERQRVQREMYEQRHREQVQQHQQELLDQGERFMQVTESANSITSSCISLTLDPIAKLEGRIEVMFDPVSVNNEDYSRASIWRYV